MSEIKENWADRSFSVVAENDGLSIFDDENVSSSEWREKYLSKNITSSSWELILNEVGHQGHTNIFQIDQVFSKAYCRELIQEAEKSNNWTEKRHDNYPTTDMLLSSFEADLSYENALRKYLYPMIIDRWRLEGPKWESLKGENFIIKYEGKGQAAHWKQIESYDPFGKIDFNKPLGLLKESVAYAYTEFESISSRTAELRLGCKNAWKIWVNGEFIFGRDEYHRGQKIDQYKMNIQLKKGKNTILVKACQNEQTEEWTVQWEFQLRICDESGVAILASNREATPVKEESERRSRRPKKS